MSANGTGRPGEAPGAAVVAGGGDAAPHPHPILATLLEAVLVVRRDGLILEANPAAQRVLAPGGLPLPGRDFWSLVPRRRRRDGRPMDRADHPVSEVLATGRPSARVVNSVERHDGTVRWVEGSAAPLRDERGQVWAVAAIFADVTERVRAEEALVEREAAFRLLAENSTDVILRADPQGRLIYASPAIQRLTGRRAEQLAGADAFANVHTDDRPVLAAALGRLLDGATSASATVRLRHADGRWVWVESVSRAVRGPDDVLVEIQSSLRGATARVRAERVLAGVAYAAERLLRDGPGGAATDDVLHRLGEAAEAHRVFLCRARRDTAGVMRWSHRGEWCAPGVPPLPHPTQPGVDPVGAGIGRWVTELEAGSAVAMPAGNLPPGERGFVSRLGAESVALVPVMTAGRWWGVLGLHDCGFPRRWSPAEVDALRAAADVVGAAIVRGRAERALQASEDRFRAAVDSISGGLIVLAPVTDAGGRTADVRITDLNAVAAAALGADRAALLGTPLSVVYPEAAAWAAERADRVIRTGVEDHAEGEFLTPGTADRRWLRYRVAPLGRECVVAFEDITDLRQREREEGALRRVAVEVAHGSPDDRLFGVLAREAAGLLGAARAVVLRAEDDALVVAGAAGDRAPGAGVRLPVTDGGVYRGMLAAGAPATIADPESVFGPATLAAMGASEPGMVVAAPVTAAARPWGLLAVISAPRDVPAAGAEAALGRFAALAGLAVESAEHRARLELRAATDPLTGLANHREFHERLSVEVARARRHGRPLSLVIIDLDHFKEVNDMHGHSAGDRVLGDVAARVLACGRPGDLVARIGGEEFAWLLPDADAAGALEAAERARAAIGAGPLAGVAELTTSAGVCDLERARGSAQALVDLADGALYWAKATGRDRAILYSPEVVNELSAEERAERLERSRQLSALRALARAVDARDHSTREHSERVAALACNIAGRMGWAADRVALLRDSALLHDVGKIGVPDAILFKPGRPTREEWAQLHLHAALGGDIVDEALTHEQASWVRHHHERWDGRGYPDGLAGLRIPEGARILALADAWDAMTAARPYGHVLTVDEALAEVRDGAGTQFCPYASAALLAIAGGPGGASGF